MHTISVDHASSFAHSMDEDLTDPGQFLPSTLGWLEQKQPVLARLSFALAKRLGVGDQGAQVAEAVVGYMIRLIEHAEANKKLLDQLEGESAAPAACPAAGGTDNGHRRYCCKRESRQCSG